MRVRSFFNSFSSRPICRRSSSATLGTVTIENTFSSPARWRASSPASFTTSRRSVFARFFDRALELDEPDQIADLIAELDRSADAYQSFLEDEGPAELDLAYAESHADHIFGVPIFVFRGELFWGHDRIPLLEERLTQHGL